MSALLAVWPYAWKYPYSMFAHEKTAIENRSVRWSGSVHVRPVGERLPSGPMKR
jgi:hypothetical protein